MTDDQPPGSWRPQGCPVARQQRYGYKHWHTQGCLYATTDQIEEDRALLESRRLVNRLRALWQRMRRLR